jgi:hypothetical protein
MAMKIVTVSFLVEDCDADRLVEEIGEACEHNAICSCEGLVESETREPTNDELELATELGIYEG